MAKRRRRRRREALVHQHLENVSRELLEQHPDIVRQFIGRNAGIYALYRKEKLYYVGLASGLRGRLKAHIKDRHGGAWDRFSIYLTIKDQHLREIEALLLRIAKPIGAKQRGKLAQSKDTHFDEAALTALMTYMSIQKLRTPKGLAWLSQQTGSGHNLLLIALQQLQNLFCAIWTECVWQIADASNSQTKFIISDHPVVVYNRACPPLSKWCLGDNEPDIRLQATHTYFPLSLEKLLILTNLSWVRNPYQNELRARPNPSLFRETIFNFLAIQIGRELVEDEVLQINWITKKRAKRYIAAAQQEWLYPERRISTDHWKKLGCGWLLMPEPRLIYMGGEVTVGYKGGGADSWSEYGHKPWQKGFKDKRRDEMESAALERFQAEWALRHGARHIAFNGDFGRTERHTDSDEMTRHYETVIKKYRRR